MSTARVHAARGFAGRERPRGLVTIDKEMPNTEELEESRVIFAADAQAVADVLWDTLPSGTFDQLVRIMLERKASLFRVAHGGKD